MFSSILYADATIEIDIQSIFDHVKALEEKVDRLQRQFEDLDAAMGVIDTDVQEGKENVNFQKFRSTYESYKMNIYDLLDLMTGHY